MANIKFSAFTNQAAADTTYLVGYDGTDNTNYDKAQVKNWLNIGTNRIPTLYNTSASLGEDRSVTLAGFDLTFVATSTGKIIYTDGNQATGYVLKSDANGKASWGAETDTTYTGGTDINISASDVINHDTIASSATTDSSTLTFGGTFTAIDSVNVSTQGHVTAKNTKTYTLPSAQTLPTGADPSATISGTVVNGSASTFMRSDAVPALGSTITIGTGGTTRGLVDIEGGSSLDAQLRLNCSAGTHAVVIEGPQHSGGSNYIIKLPHGAPALNKILKVGTYTANAGSYADPSLATMIWADDTDTTDNIYNTSSNLTADRTVTMNNIAANAPYNLTFAGITTSKVTFSNLGGVEIARDLTVQKNVIIQGQGYSELNAMTANTFAPDWNIGNVQSVTLTQASTFAPTNPKAGATYILIVTNTNAAITWGSYIKWAAPDTQAAPPELSGSGKTDVITLICYDGSTTNGLYYGSITKDLS